MKLFRKAELLIIVTISGWLLFVGCSHSAESFSPASSMSVILRGARTATLAAGAPELPRVYLDTTYTPPTGRTIPVAAGGDLQAAINQAQFGDVITLQAGATFTGNFTLPNKSSGGQTPGWITIRTSTPDSG